jgi:beta-lactamase class A
MRNPALLDKKIFYKKADLTNWTPITGKYLDSGMTIEALAAAAISYSDNTAMNLLAKELGGTPAVNAFARSIGDADYKQDHLWPAEALSSPASNQDSTTPAAMERSFQRLALGDVLAPMQHEKLLVWLKANTTGDARIRAGVPKGWVVGDKTGTGFHYGTTNDIAILWPPQCAPIVVTLYYSSDQKNAPKREDVLASATRILLNDFARTNPCVAKNMA